ncbi:TPA: hypothetical protein QCR36_004082 [Bacillus cereus]|uniref:hypothetical protein n=1 Tax=Bacillus TaxID=1386 RepID=UPI000BF6AA20|nr:MULTISPECIES: hypothetical protein [Bacillus]MBG0967674.1 hypothetical protein [Bacillus sp. SRB3LM]MBJ8109132.1 hypothetical protein [Bacillus cereus group sp. N6]MDA1616361.1 hypothetical protein [Bacillus cereus group sp. TH204-1LC]MDA1918337.1 hypothetical protein [Bacillus cereus group sp. BcHK140]MDA1977029.1 hypothetical protein [Bacillus cereus]
MLEITTNENSIYLAKEETKGLVAVVARKIEEGIIEITYFCNGVTKVLKSASLLASRMIAGLMEADYAEVDKAVRGVA